MKTECAQHYCIARGTSGAYACRNCYGDVCAERDAAVARAEVVTMERELLRGAQAQVARLRELLGMSVTVPPQDLEAFVRGALEETKT